MHNDARETLGDAINDGGYEGWGQKWIAPDAHLAGRRVGQKFDIFYANSQVIEHR